MASTVAHRLIAASETSPERFDWISRQLQAGRKPSEILRDLETTADRICAAMAAVGIRLAFASSATFALAFVWTAMGLR
jgi:hypothetical protein